MYIHAKLMTWTHNYDNNDYLQPTKPVYTSSEEDIFCGLGNMHKSSLLQHMYIPWRSGEHLLHSSIVRPLHQCVPPDWQHRVD